MCRSGDIAKADVITPITSTPANANDSVGYLSQLGPDGTNVNSGSTVTSSNGNVVTFTFTGQATTCDTFRYTCNDTLPSSTGSLAVSGSSLLLSFSSPVSAIWTTFEDESDVSTQLPFTGTISLALYDGKTLLGTVTQTESEYDQIYIGATSSSADITSAVLSIASEATASVGTASFSPKAGRPGDAISCSNAEASDFDPTTDAGIFNTLNCPIKAYSVKYNYNAYSPTLRPRAEISCSRAISPSRQPSR